MAPFEWSWCVPFLQPGLLHAQYGFSTRLPTGNAMNDQIRPATKPAFVPDPDARKDADDPELDEGEPGVDENAAGFLKNAIDKPAKQ